ncbi:MAG: hypothetical protein JW973_17630 [Bacteroidales bacterium]|nr:hypothetical protein [Bacteroidales bacterium]
MKKILLPDWLSQYNGNCTPCRYPVFQNLSFYPQLKKSNKPNDARSKAVCHF